MKGEFLNNPAVGAIKSKKSVFAFTLQNQKAYSGPLGPASL